MENLPLSFMPPNFLHACQSHPFDNHNQRQDSVLLIPLGLKRSNKRYLITCYLLKNNVVERKNKITKMAPEIERGRASVCAGGPAESGAYFSEARIILDSMGSTGSSAIFRPD